MSTGSPKRHRSNLELPPGQLERTLEQLRRGEVLIRIGLCFAAAIAMWLLTFGWQPPFGYRTGDIAPRDIVARTKFSRDDPSATDDLRREARRATLCIYQHDVRSLIERRQELKDKVSQVIRSESFETLDPTVWKEFLPDAEQGLDANAQFDSFRAALADDLDLMKFEAIAKRAFEAFETNGLLDGTEHERIEGNRYEILVHPIGSLELLSDPVEVKDVRLAEAHATLRNNLDDQFKSSEMIADHSDVVEKHVLAWFSNRPLPTTLTLNVDATNEAKDEAVSKVETVQITYSPGNPILNEPGDLLAKGGKRLTEVEIDLLKREYRALNLSMSLGHRFGHFIADMGMYTALYMLCGFFIYYREPRLLSQMWRFSTILGLVVLTVGLCSFLSFDNVRGEIIPLFMLGVTVAVAYRQELALLLSTGVSLTVVLSLGQGLVEFVIYMATVASAIQMVSQIQSRTKLIYVGACAGLVAAMTTVGVSTVASQVFGERIVAVGGAETSLTVWDSVGWALLLDSARYGLAAFLGGILMTVFLPFIEKIYDVQTDISLLELGVNSHPLLQELVQRAPGTHNHSINVASISEAAADAIGANGLLCRVGAYFHDIGKMLKPSYFVENQDVGVNRHESLVPAMSTLVIIAHVKDGADLARQHRLPQSIIDFIEQHHGTTLVEYFFDQATKKQEEDPDTAEVEEANFRYPGPKPQTKEAGVIMVADAAESASRTLVEPTPARIESLVHEMVMKRLLGGQFDECGLTLKELHTVELSIVKSLTAVYHGRVKYPEKQDSA